MESEVGPPRHPSRTRKPIFLLADCQMLFWRDRNVRFISRAVEALELHPQQARAAYLGASNGDTPEFFDLFKAAFGDLGVSNAMHVHAEASLQELAFLQDATLILLAGGDIDLGYRAFEKAGLVGCLRSRWSDGAILIGVSAGAVQIGIRNYQFEHVKHEICNACGERIFDLEISRMFDEKILSR